MEVIDFREKNSNINHFHYDDDDFMDDYPKGNLHCSFDNHFKYTDNYLKFIPVNRNTIFELIIGNRNVKPYMIRCYDKMQIYQGGKRRNISINSFVFREFIGVDMTDEDSEELMGLKVRISNKLLDQLLFSEKEI